MGGAWDKLAAKGGTPAPASSLGAPGGVAPGCTPLETDQKVGLVRIGNGGGEQGDPVQPIPGSSDSPWIPDGVVLQSRSRKAGSQNVSGQALESLLILAVDCTATVDLEARVGPAAELDRKLAAQPALGGPHC